MSSEPATTGKLAIDVLRSQAARFLELAPGARAGRDAEAVHQMRVAARRMRAALRLFGDVLPDPDASRLNAELKWIAGQLGDVRDLDVQIKRVDAIAAEANPQAALRPFSVWLAEAQRRPAQATLEAALRSPRFVDVVQALHHVDDWTPSREVSLRQDAPRRLRRAFKALDRRARRLAVDSPASDFHKVRIRAKRLRYAAEFLTPVYGKAARRLAKRVVALQDLLGDLQDGTVGEQRIHAAVEAVGASWPADTLLALGQVVQLNADRAHQLRRAFVDAYGDVIGKAWRRLASKVAMS